MTRRRKIALVNASGVLSSSPLSLGDIAAYALSDEDVRKEVDIKIFNFPKNLSYEKEVQAVLEFDPFLVGFSAYSWNYYALQKIAQMIKEARKETWILFGGPNVSGNKRIEDCLRDCPYMDFIIDGEGEIGFLQLVKTVLQDSHDEDSYKEVRNLGFRYDGKPTINPTGARIADLDEIPSPYLSNILDPHPGPVLWETNRGCPYRCAYCYWGNGKSKLYQYSTARLEEELRWFARSGVHHFWVADANFGILPRDREIAELFCRINSEEGRPFRHFGVNWAKNSSEKIVEIAEIFTKNQVVCSLTIAYQTLTPEAEELSQRKSLSLESGGQLLRAASERNIPVYTDLIWGLPGESYSEFLAGIDKVVDLGVPSVMIHILEVIPGTKYYEEKEKFGFQTLAAVEHSQELVLSHPKMSIQDQQKGVRAILIHHLFHTYKTSHVLNRYLQLTLGVKHSQVCEAFLDYLEQDHECPISEEAQVLRKKIHEGVISGGSRHGANIDESMNTIAFALWDHRNAVEELLLDFYQEFLSALSRVPSAEEWDEIREILRFNLLISPKPGWTSREPHTFNYDVGRFYEESMRHWVSVSSSAPTPKLKRRVCSYRFTNPWLTRPHIDNRDWACAVVARMCRYKELQPVHST